MKKEINQMLTLGSKTKILKLNGAFTLETNYIDSDGFNVEVSNKEPVRINLTLVYNLSHDKCYRMSEEIKSRNCEDVISEISSTMEKMLNDITAQLVKNFNNGYLLGKVN